MTHKSDTVTVEMSQLNDTCARRLCLTYTCCVPVPSAFHSSRQRTAEVQGHSFPPISHPASAASTAAIPTEATTAATPLSTSTAAAVLRELGGDGDGEVSRWTFVDFLERAALLRRVLVNRDTAHISISNYVVFVSCRTHEHTDK